MNKKEMTAAMAEKTNLTKNIAAQCLEAALETIGDVLAKGEKISLIDFGTFSVTERAARDGRNPQTGKKLKIPAKKVVKFKPGKNLKEKVDK